MLKDLTTRKLQEYFSAMARDNLQHESRDKIRDVVSSVLPSAVTYGLLPANPMDEVRMPPERRGKKRSKPYVSHEQFEHLILLIPEPYATMVYVAIYTGLRVSELAGLKWDDVGETTITIDERFCRGDWGAPKSESSNATIPVNRTVTERIHRMKLLTLRCELDTAIQGGEVLRTERPGTPVGARRQAATRQ